MTKYDCTGPVEVDERKSLVIFLSVVAVIAVGAWLTLEIRELALRPIAAAASSQPATASEDHLAEGLNRISDNLMILKVADTVILFPHNENNVWPSRSYSRDNPDAAERWRLASIFASIARDPAAAEKYDATNVAEKLRQLNFRFPQLTYTQRMTLRDLFLAWQEPEDGDRAKAEQALVDAAANMPIPLDELQEFNNNIDKARALMTPAQLELIRTGGKRAATKVASRPSATGEPQTRPAAPAATKPAK